MLSCAILFAISVTANSRSVATPSFSRLELGAAGHMRLNLGVSSYLRLELGLAFIIAARTRCSRTPVVKLRCILFIIG